ncbi:MAG: amino acid ABC transporter permease [Chloroflexi bacterium]|nr:amino acid ABC transporter permease [Chloroflexota bacterium]
MTVASTGGFGTRAGGLAPPEPNPIVAAIAAQRRRQTRRFRIIFVATWAVLIGGLLGALVAAGRIDFPFIREWGPYILGGVWTTIFVAVCSITIAILFAIVGALGRLSSNPVLFSVSTLYVSLVRGTPLLVQILFIYLALPQIIPGVSEVPAIALGIFALSFNYGAYMTETFRAGIQAVPRGQTEAAEALGMPGRTRMRRIVLPQAIRIITPAIGNEFISMIKDSSLVSVIAVPELLWRAQRVGQSNFRTLETLMIAAAIYWGLTIVLSLVQDRLEKRMAESDRRI